MNKLLQFPFIWVLCNSFSFVLNPFLPAWEYIPNGEPELGRTDSGLMGPVKLIITEQP